MRWDSRRSVGRGRGYCYYFCSLADGMCPTHVSIHLVHHDKTSIPACRERIQKNLTQTKVQIGRRERVRVGTRALPWKIFGRSLSKGMVPTTCISSHVGTNSTTLRALVRAWTYSHAGAASFGDGDNAPGSLRKAAKRDDWSLFLLITCV